MSKTECCAFCLQFVSSTNGNCGNSNCRRNICSKPTGGGEFKLTSKILHSEWLVYTNIFIVARVSNRETISPHVLAIIRSLVETVLESSSLCREPQTSYVCVWCWLFPHPDPPFSLSLNAYPVKNREPKNYSRNSNTLGVSCSFQRLSLFKRITKVIITLLDRVVEASCWFLISAASNRNFCKKSMPSSIRWNILAEPLFSRHAY